MINIVCGPPGSGKTTYVQDHASWGDLICDVDALYHALTGLPWYEKPDRLLPFVLKVRDVIIDWTLHYHGQAFYNAWIITGGARMEMRNRLAMRLRAKVYVLETSATECIRRISQDPRRAASWQLWQDLVNRWWQEYEKSDSDIVIRS